MKSLHLPVKFSEKAGMRLCVLYILIWTFVGAVTPAYALDGPICRSVNEVVSGFVNSKVEKPPVKPLPNPQEEANRVLTDLDRRFVDAPGSLSYVSRFEYRGVLDDVQNLNESSRITLQRIDELTSGPKPSRQNLEQARDMLDQLKRKSEFLSVRLKYLGGKDPDLAGLVQKPLKDMENDRKKLQEALDLYKKNKGLSNDAIQSNLRGIMHQGIMTDTNGSLGELQIVSRLPVGAQKDIRVANIALQESKTSLAAEAQSKIGQSQLRKMMNDAFPTSNLTAEEKLKILTQKEIDARYIEKIPGSSNSVEVWTEVKNLNHKMTIYDLTNVQAHKADRLMRNNLEQLQGMVTARDIYQKVTGKTVQLEIICVKDIAPEAKAVIERTFPGVFRFR